MAYEDFTKHIRINEKQLNRLKILAAQKKMSATRFLDKILDEILGVLSKENQEELKKIAAGHDPTAQKILDKEKQKK